MTCSRCGGDTSVFWYPYAFAVSPRPSPTERCIDRSQYFMLCDVCQEAFIRFMRDQSPRVKEAKE